MIVEVVGERLTVKQEPKDWVTYLEGLGHEVWEGVDVEHYIRESRGECLS